MIKIIGSLFFFFNDTATTEIYTLSLHYALPIYPDLYEPGGHRRSGQQPGDPVSVAEIRDRKSTRLNSSHLVISYAVFCLKKKKPVPTVVTVLHLMRPGDPTNYISPQAHSPCRSA